VFVDDPNIAPYLGGADVLVSDVSSVVMEFMALDKPVILFDHPQMTRYHGYNPNDIEHAWRDLGTRAGSFDAVRNALTDVLANGDACGERRRDYAARLFADRAGDAAARVWRATLDTLAANAAQPSRPPLVPLWSLVLEITPDNLFLVRSLLDQIQFVAVMPIELRLAQLGTSPALERYVALLREHAAFASVHVTVAPDAASFERTLSDVARAATGDYMLFLRPHVRVHRGFDYFLHETFRHHPAAAALTPVFTSGVEPNRAAFAKGPLEGLTAERTSYQFLNWYRGRSIAEFKSTTPPPVIALRRAFLKRLPPAFFTGLAGLAASGHLKVAPSVSCALMPGAAIHEARTYLDATGETRRALALTMLKNGMVAFFPDVALRVIGDLDKAGAGGAEIEPVLAMATHERLLDLPAQQAVRAVLRRHPGLTRALKHDIGLAERLLEAAAASRAGVGSPTVLAG
jgi:CDP-glycerol glycerophosphotransferase (TagB/SpsB family)